MNLDGLYRMQGMLFSLMILGAFLKKKGIITDEGKRVIADLVIFVTLPCSIIESFEVELSMDILKSSAQALLVSCMVQVACYILNMVLYPGVGEEKKKVLKYATMASNAGILGNPVAEGIFGSMGLFYASCYLIPQRTAMWSLGMTYFTKAPDRRTLIKKICTHPCIVSVFIGFVLMLLQMQIPGFLGDTVHSLNKANTAVSMIFVGTGGRYEDDDHATQLLLCRRAPDPDPGACVDRLPPVPYRHAGDGDFCGAGSDAGSKHDGDSCREIWRG